MQLPGCACTHVTAYHAGCVLVHVLLHLHQLRVAAAAGVELGLVAELQVAAILQQRRTQCVGKLSMCVQVYAIGAESVGLV